MTLAQKISTGYVTSMSIRTLEHQQAMAPTLPRLPALDGLRGCLALLVLTFHLTNPCPITYQLMLASRGAVGAFFILSGWVLVRNWDGRYGLFLVRRFVRLWPTFAICMAAGAILIGRQLSPSQLVWYPLATPYHGAEIDPPAWSLFIEAWAMPFLPVLARFSRVPLSAAALAAGIFVVGILTRPEVLYGLLFLVGACLSHFDWRSRVFESRAIQWFGRISYSLYLTHWLVLTAFERWFGHSYMVLALPVMLGIAWLTWWAVERPSILLSRRVGMVSS